MPTYPAAVLASFAQSVFEHAGVPASEAVIVSRSLVDANLCGHDSHGVMRLPQYIELIRKGSYRPGTELTVLNETPAVLAADANWGLGQVQAYRLLDRLLPKVQQLGIAAGTLRNCGHTGRLGEYAEFVTARGFALIATVNSHGSGRRVAPPGGTEGRISTNPLCIGVPTQGDPVIIDFGTSAVAEGKVRAQFQKKEAAPEGWLVDHRGLPTTDPGVLYSEPRGSILPFGGPQAYKGFGLGLILDMLSGALSGGPCSNAAYPLAGQGNTVLLIVLSPASFGGIDHFLKETSGLSEYVRGCPTAAGTSTITLPGDPERMARSRRSVEGIAIPEATWELIARVASEVGVPLPSL